MTNYYTTLTQLENGFLVRPAVREDVTTVTQLINEHSQRLHGELALTETELLNEWDEPTFDLETHSRVVVEPQTNQIVGYIEHHKDPIPIRNFFWARVHPDHLNQGIGTYMMHWAEEQTKACVSLVPVEETVVMMVACDSREQEAAQLFQEYGLHLTRQFDNMLIEFETPPTPPEWPNDLTLTTFAEFNDLAAIWQAVDDAFRDHWGYTERPLEEALASFQHYINSDEYHDPTAWLVALSDEEVAGVCICKTQTTEDRDKGHVDRLAVKRPFRKQGLGMALLKQAFYVLAQKGTKRVDLGVDSESMTGATRLYERAGMHVYRRTDAYEKAIS